MHTRTSLTIYYFLLVSWFCSMVFSAITFMPKDINSFWMGLWVIYCISLFCIIITQLVLYALEWNKVLEKEKENVKS